MKRKREDVVNEVMDHFDYEKVLKAMDALDWKWVSVDTMHVSDLRRGSRRLLNQAFLEWEDTKEDQNIATGGFVAKMKSYEEDFNDAKLSLAFQVSEWDAEVFTENNPF